MTRRDRIVGGVDLERLNRSTVFVVGLGSGGSTVAVELAKAGVGRLLLCDPDVLEPGNVRRHECDAGYVGWAKVQAVAELVLRSNPEVDVNVIHAAVEEIEEEDLDEILTGADLLAVCTDTERSRHLLNAHARSSGTAAVYGGVYAGAAGGEVIVCRAGEEEPCLACVESVLREQLKPTEAELPDYGVLSEGGDLRAAPGLGVDVRLIALIHAKVCLTLLSDQGDSANVVLFATTALDNLLPRPFASARARIARQPGCLICAHPRP